MQTPLFADGDKIVQQQLCQGRKLIYHQLMSVCASGMMSEIIQRGPITCSIACPDDFIWNYTGGVYTDKNNSTDVDHDVEVVGWGHEDGKDFWHIRNSWGNPLH